MKRKFFLIITIFLRLLIASKTLKASERGGAIVFESEQTKLSAQDAKLLKSCSEGSLYGVRKALSYENGVKANVEARDPGIGNTPLIWAAFHGHVDIMEFLLGQGAYIEAVSRDGHKTALLLAVYSGHVEAVLFLIRNGAQIDAANSRGDTSLAIAAYMNHLEIVQLLMQRRASLLSTTHEHRYTPLHLAAYKGHIDIHYCRVYSRV